MTAAEPTPPTCTCGSEWKHVGHQWGCPSELWDRLLAAEDRNREYAAALTRVVAENREWYGHEKDQRPNRATAPAMYDAYVLAANPPDGTSARARVAELEAKLATTNAVLRTIEGDTAAGSCDWGYCDRDATGWRYDEERGEPLPVCGEHQPEYDSARAELAKAREEIGRLRDQIAACQGFEYRELAERYEQVLQRVIAPPALDAWAIRRLARQALATTPEERGE